MQFDFNVAADYARTDSSLCLPAKSLFQTAFIHVRLRPLTIIYNTEYYYSVRCTVQYSRFRRFMHCSFSILTLIVKQSGIHVRDNIYFTPNRASCCLARDLLRLQTSKQNLLQGKMVMHQLREFVSVVSASVIIRLLTHCCLSPPG